MKLLGCFAAGVIVAVWIGHVLASCMAKLALGQ